MRTNTRDQCSTCDNESETESEFYAYLKKNDLEARKLEASKLRIETKKARKANKNNTQKEKREKKKKSQLEVKKGARNKKRNPNKKTKKIMKKKKKPKNLLKKKILETIHMIEMRDKTESLFRKTELNGTSASQQSFGATCNATNSQALIPSGSIVLPIVIKQEFHAPNNCSTNNDEESNSDSSVELLGEYRPAKRRKLHSSKKSRSSRACFKNLGSELVRDASLNPPKINVPAEKIKDENDVEVTSCLRPQVQSDSFLPFPPCTFTYSYQETDNKAFQVPSVNVSCPSTSSPLLANPLDAGSNFNPQILVSKCLFQKPIGVNLVNSSPTVEDQSLVHQIQKCIRENVRSSIENFFLKRNISEITNIPQGIPSRSATSTEVSCEETGCDPKNDISKNVSRTGLTPISSLPSHQVLSDSSYEDNMTMRCTSCLRFRSEDRRKTNNKVCAYDQISKPSAQFFNADDGLTCCSCVTGNTRQSPHQITSQNEKRQQCETNTQQKNEECGNHACNGVTQIQKNMEKPRQIENEMKISSSFCNYKSEVPHPTKTGLNKEKVSLPSENKLLENNAAVGKRIPPTSTSPKNCTDRYSQACESRINERDDDSMLAITLNILRARSGKNVENIYSLETIEKLNNCYKSQSAINNNGSKTGDVLQEIDDFVSTIKLLSKDIVRIEKQEFSTFDSSDSTQCTVNDSPVGCNTISTDITADSDRSSKAISSKCFISSDSTQEALEQKFKDEDESCIRKPSDKSFSASSDVKIDVSYTNERNVNEGTTKLNENDKERIQNLNTVPVSSNDNVCRNTVEDEQDIHQITNKIPGEDTSQVKTLEHSSSQALDKERKFANNSSELSNQLEEKNSEVSDITLLKDCNRESNEITLLISTDKVEKDPQHIPSTALSNTSMENIVTNGPRDKGNETVDGFKISMNGENKLSDTLDNIDNSSARDDSLDINSTVKSNIILNQSDNTNATDNVIEAHQTLAKIINIKGNSDDNEAGCTLHSTGKITPVVDLHHCNNNSNESENSSPLHSPSKSRIARDSKDYIEDVTTDSMKDGAPCTNLDPVQDIILNTKCDNTTERSSPSGLHSPGKTKLSNDMDNVENDSTLEYISSASSAPEQTVILKYPCDDICKANNISESSIPRERFQDIQKNNTANLRQHIEPPIYPTSDACTRTLASHILQDDPQKTEKTPSKEATKEIQEFVTPTHPTSDGYTGKLVSHISQDHPQKPEKTPLKEVRQGIQEIESPTHPTSVAYTGTLASHILQDDTQKTQKTSLKEATKEIQEFVNPTHPTSDACTGTFASHILQDDPQKTEKTSSKAATKEIQEFVTPIHPTSDACTSTPPSHILQDDPQKTEKTPLKEVTKEIQEFVTPTHPTSEACTSTLASPILQDDPQKTEKTPSKEATKEIQEFVTPTHPTSEACTSTLASHILQDDPQKTEKTPLKEVTKEIQEFVTPTHPTSEACTTTLASHILQDDPQKTEKTPSKEATKEIQEFVTPTHPTSEACTSTLASHILQDDPQKTEKTPSKEVTKEIQEFVIRTHSTSDAYTGTLASHILQDDPQKTEKAPLKEVTKEIQEFVTPTHPTSEACTSTLASHILQDDPQKTEKTPSKEATKEIQEFVTPTHPTSEACTSTLASHILQDDPQKTEKTPLKEVTKEIQEFVTPTHPTSDACTGTLASHILQDDPQKTEKTPSKEVTKEIQEFVIRTHSTSDAYTGTLASHILQDDPQKTEKTPLKEVTKEIQEFVTPTHPTSEACTSTLASHILQDDPQKTEKTPSKEATKEIQEFVTPTHPTSEACTSTLASHILQDDPQKTEKTPSKEAKQVIQEIDSPTHPTSDACTGTLASHILQDDPQKPEKTPLKEVRQGIQEIDSPTHPTSDACTGTLVSHISQDDPQKPEKTPLKEVRRGIQEIYSTESKYDVNLSQNVEIEAKEFPTEIMIGNTTKTSTTDNSDNVLITTESPYYNTYKNIEVVMCDESVPRTSCQSLINDVNSNEQDAIISNQETNTSVSERDLRLSSSNLNNPSSCDAPETCSSLHQHLFQNKKDDLLLNGVAAIGKGRCSPVCSDKMMSCDGTHMSATGSGGFPESPVHIQDNITLALPEKYLDLSCYQNSKNVIPHRIENCFDNSSQTGKTTCDQQNLVEQLNVDPCFNTASTLRSDGGVESNINDVSISDATVHIGEIVAELSNDSEKRPKCSSLLNDSADNEVIDGSPLKIQPVYLTHSALIPEHTATESSKEEVNINISEQNAKFLTPLQQKDTFNDFNTERINYNIQQQSTSNCNENGADGVHEYSEELFNKNYRTAEPAEFSSVSILETENYEVINGDNQQEKKSCIPGSANLHNEDERDSIGEYPKDGADQNISPNKHNVLSYDSTSYDLKFDSSSRDLTSDFQARNDLKVRQYFRCMRQIFDVSYNFENADQDSDGSAKTNFISRDGSGVSPVISDHSVKKLTKSSENNLMSGNNIEMDTMMSNDNEDNKSCFRAAISSEFSAHNTSVVLNEKPLTLSNNSPKDKIEPKSDYENSINDNFNSTLHDRQRTFYYADKDNDEISNDKTVGETSVGNRRADELSRTVFVENNSNTAIACEPSHSAQNTTELDRCRIVKHSGKIQSSSCSNSGTSSECAICTKKKVAVSVNNINETQLYFSEHGCSIYENSMEDTEMPSGYPPSHDASISLCSTSKEFINSAEDVSIFASNPIISLKVSGENENYFDTVNSTDMLISNVQIVKDDAKISNSTFSERNDSSSMEHHVIDLSRGGSPISTEAQTSNSRGNTYENDTSLCQRSTIANDENEKLTGIPILPLQFAASLQTPDSISILNENTTKIKDVNDQRVDSGNEILEHTGKESHSVNNKEIISNSNNENMGVDGVNSVFDPQIQDTMLIPKSVLCNEENILIKPEDFTEKQSNTPMGVNNERNSTIRFDDDVSDSIIHHDNADNVCMLSPKSFLPADTTIIESSNVGKNNSVYLDKTIMDTHLCSENADKDVSTSSLEFQKNTVKYSSTTDSASPIQRSEKKKDRVVSCKSDTKPRKKSARKKSNGREPSSPTKNKALVDDNISKSLKSGKKKKDSEVETSTTSHKKKYREHHHESLLSKSKKLLKSKSKKCKSSTTLEDSNKCLSDTENKEYKDENNAMSLPPFKTQNAPQQTSSDTNHDSFPDERNVLLNCPSTSKNYQIENISVSDHDNESQSIIHNVGGYERLNDDSHDSASPSSKALKSNSNADCNERRQAKINRSIRRNDQYDNAIHKKHDSDYRKHPLYPLRMFLLSRSRRAFMNRLRSELSEDSATSVSKDLSANEPLEAEYIHNKLNTPLTTEDPSIDQNNITESSVTNISATEKATDFNLSCHNVVNATNYGNVKTSVYECTQPSEVTNPNLEIENNKKISILDKSFQEHLLNDEREDANELTEKGSLNELSYGNKNMLNESARKKKLCKNTHPFGIESHTSKPRDEQPIDKGKLRISPSAADANMYSKNNCKEEGLSMIQPFETNEYSEEFTKTSLVPNTLPLAENPPFRTTTSSREGPVTAFPKRNHSSFINYRTEYVSDNTISWFNTESNSMETNDATHTKRHYANNLLEFSSTESDYLFKPLTETSDSQFHSSKNGVNSSFTGVGGQRKSYITRQNEIVKWSMDFETLHPPTPVFISDDSAFVESDFEREIEEFPCYSSMVSKFNAEVCISKKHNASRIKNSSHGNDNTWSEKLDGTTRRSPVRECGAQTSDADGRRDGAKCSTCAVCRQSAFCSTLVPVKSMDVNDSFFQNSTDSPYEPGDENYTLFQVESHGNRNRKWGFVSERCKGCLRTKCVSKRQRFMSPSMSHETENSSDDENMSEDIWTLDRDGFRLRSFNTPSDPRLRSAWYMSRLQFYPKYCRPSPEVPWPEKLSEVEIMDDKLRHPDRSNLVDPMPRELKTDGKRKSSGGREDMCIFEGVSDNHERRSSRQDPRIRSGQEIPIPQLPKTLKRYEPIYDRLARGEAAVELTFEVETARSQSAPPCVLRGRENHVRGAPQPQQRSCRRTASEVRRTPSPDASPPHTIFPIPTSSANPTQPSVTRPASAPSTAFLSSPGRASMPSLAPAPRPSRSPAARTSPRDPRLLHADAPDVGGGKDGRGCMRRLTFDGSDASSRAGPANHGVIWRVNAHGDETVDPRIGSVARRWGTWLLRTGAEAHELREEAARTRGRGRLSGQRCRDVDTRRTKCADGQRLNLSSDEQDSTLHVSPHALHAAHKDAEKRARNCGNDNVTVPNLNDSHSPNDPQFVHFQRNLSEDSVALRCPQTERGVDINNKDVISSHSFSADDDDDEVVMISPPYQEETQLSTENLTKRSRIGDSISYSKPRFLKLSQNGGSVKIKRAVEDKARSQVEAGNKVGDGKIPSVIVAAMTGDTGLHSDKVRMERTDEGINQYEIAQMKRVEEGRCTPNTATMKSSHELGNRFENVGMKKPDELRRRYEQMEMEKGGEGNNGSDTVEMENPDESRIRSVEVAKSADDIERSRCESMKMKRTDPRIVNLEKVVSRWDVKEKNCSGHVVRRCNEKERHCSSVPTTRWDVREKISYETTTVSTNVKEKNYSETITIKREYNRRLCHTEKRDNGGRFRPDSFALKRADGGRVTAVRGQTLLSQCNKEDSSFSSLMSNGSSNLTSCAGSTNEKSPLSPVELYLASLNKFRNSSPPGSCPSSSPLSRPCSPPGSPPPSFPSPSPPHSISTCRCGDSSENNTSPLGSCSQQKSTSSSLLEIPSNDSQIVNPSISAANRTPVEIESNSDDGASSVMSLASVSPLRELSSPGDIPPLPKNPPPIPPPPPPTSPPPYPPPDLRKVFYE